MEDSETLSGRGLPMLSKLTAHFCNALSQCNASERNQNVAFSATFNGRPPLPPPAIQLMPGQSEDSEAMAKLAGAPTHNKDIRCDLLIVAILAADDLPQN